MLLAPTIDDGSIWRRVHFNYLLCRNAKKKQTVIVVVRNMANPVGAKEYVRMTHVSGSHCCYAATINQSRCVERWHHITSIRFMIPIEKQYGPFVVAVSPAIFRKLLYLDFIPKSIGVPPNASSWMDVFILGLDARTSSYHCYTLFQVHESATFWFNCKNSVR